MSSEQPSEIEVDLSKAKFKAKGIYEDLRPLVTTGVTGINHILKVAENLIGLPADYINNHLSRFRERYRDGVLKIPEDRRELPPFRLICVTMREASYATDEPDLQEMFAYLLLAGSDRSTKQDAHPGFAATISQLSSYDAEMLLDLKAKNWKVRMRELLRLNDGERDITDLVFYSLRRLGLVDWWNVELDPFFPQTASRNFAARIGSAAYEVRDNPHEQYYNLAQTLKHATEDFARDIVHAIEYSRNIGVMTTPYGELFVRTCLGNDSASDDP